MKKIQYLLIAAIVAAMPLYSAQAQTAVDEKLRQELQQSAKRKQQIAEHTDKNDERLKRMLRSRPRRVKWSDEINLSKEQKHALAEIYKQNDRKLAALMADMEQQMQQIREIYENENGKVRMLLDEKQQIKYDKYMLRLQKSRGEKVDGKKPSRKRMHVY